MKKVKHATHLFIDTNIFLNFFAYSNDDLEELEKLVTIVKSKVVKLYITQQVVDEFYRNRDSRLSESFDQFRPFGNEQCPKFMTGLPEYKEFKKTLTNYKEARKNLQEKAREQADARELLADELFCRIVKQANVIAIDDEAYASADKRASLGNPPGKSRTTIGDELNWELLLTHVPVKSDLHVITKDSDYTSTLNPGQPKVFLNDEWMKKKEGQLFVYEQIGLFFKANYPDEAFSLEIEKKESIEALVGSPNFRSTHSAIAQLNPYIEFMTTEEAEEVIQGALSNSQVAWIVSDSDVEEFLTKMLTQHGESMSMTLKNRLKEALGVETEDKQEITTAGEIDEEDIPF